jgi:hypothetical protein
VRLTSTRHRSVRSKVVSVRVSVRVWAGGLGIRFGCGDFSFLILHIFECGHANVRKSTLLDEVLGLAFKVLEPNPG